MDEKQAQRQAEKHKALAEYLRFLTTLSTGSLVLLTSFLDKLHAQPSSWVAVAFIAFTVCIATSVVSYSVVTMNFGRQFEAGEVIFTSSVLILAFVSFIVAIVALTVFGVANLRG